MSQHQESSSEEAIEISIKKTPHDRLPKEKKKIVKQKSKAKSQINSKIQDLLKDKIEDEAILKQLEAKPFDFGDRENKIIKITENTENRKKLDGLGISLVHPIKKQKRTAVNHLEKIINKTTTLRKDMANIRNLKKR